MPLKKIGIIGDGQLAKMLIQAGHNIYEGLEFYVYPVNTLDKNTNTSTSICNGLAKFVYSYKELFEVSDVITYEFENISALDIKYIRECLDDTKVIPSFDILEMIQSKVLQKEFYKNHDIPTASFQIFNSGLDLKNYLQNHPEKPFIIKKNIGGYNGIGVLDTTYANILDDFILNTNDNFILDDFLLKTNDSFILEEKVKIKKELGVMVLRSGNQIISFEPVEMFFKSNNILDYYISPANISENIYNQLTFLVKNIVNLLNHDGLYGIELFLTEDDTLLVNEISPRPHNSGHHTIESATYSQYNLLVKLLLGFKIEDNNVEQPALMVNILGSNFNGSATFDLEKVNILLSQGVSVHNYQKKYNTPERKMGHLTYLGSDPETIKMIHNFKSKLVILSNVSLEPKQKPIIGVIMGSISDYNIIRPIINVLDEFGILYECKVVSAHRMPLEMYDYAKKATEKGLKVIIACAGGSAHLPGMTASLTTIPIIGLPVNTTTLNGLDSLYSIVQMPKGVPVATVGIDNGINAGLLAIRILSIDTSLEYLELENKLKKYAEKNREEAIKSNSQISK